MNAHLSPLAIASLVCAIIAVAILVVYLVWRPPLTQAIKIWLLLGLGAFPISAAFGGNVEGYETSKKRAFCASCHVMSPETSDSDNPHGTSLSSEHARNALFGTENCYVCHDDYGMFGTVLTKVGGMKHAWLYYTEYLHVSAEAAKKTIHLYKPFPNSNCMQCHSTNVDLWSAVPSHKAVLADVRSGAMSCAAVGCHGYAHPNARSEGSP